MPFYAKPSSYAIPSLVFGLWPLSEPATASGLLKEPLVIHMETKDIEQLPADTFLKEELTEDILVETANLTSAQTGVPGIIFISTMMGQHGPRVKYYLQPGRTQPSFSVTIADTPTVAANSLPARVARRMAPPVIAWVSRNKDALLDFWHHGDTWTQPEVNAFIQKLQSV